MRESTRRDYSPEHNVTLFSKPSFCFSFLRAKRLSALLAFLFLAISSNDRRASFDRVRRCLEFLARLYVQSAVANRLFDLCASATRIYELREPVLATYQQQGTCAVVSASNASLRYRIVQTVYAIIALFYSLLS